MSTAPFDIGFRVVGGKTAKRRAIRHADAFAAYAQCDPLAHPDREAYLSLFVFDGAFAAHLDLNGTEAAYAGPCGASWLWWDIDRADDLKAALSDARRLAGGILDRYPDLDEDDLLVFLSGSKGVHVGIPAVWRPEPSPDFHGTAKRFCLDLAEGAGIIADGSIYTKTRLFRAPNSPHPKTGSFKRRLSLAELTHLKPEAVIERAREPEPFDIPTGPLFSSQAADDWSKARQSVVRRSVRQASRHDGPSKLSAFALRYLRDGELDPGQREVSTFRVAAELTEIYLKDGFDRVLFALLEDAALDSGLTPSEAKHAIEGGLLHARRREGGAS